MGDKMISVHPSETRADFLRYYLPLALQAMSQVISYPMVAIVAAHGDGGVLNVAGFSQASALMFLVSLLGGGMMTTGLVHGNTREGFQNFSALNRRLMIATVLMQIAICLPPIDHLIFATILGLSPDLAKPARLALLALIPAQCLFFLRAPYQAALLGRRSSGPASLATAIRILFTVVLVVLCISTGRSGIPWAATCLALPVLLEVLASRMFARRIIDRLPSSGIAPTSLRSMFSFNCSLSAGPFSLSFSSVLLGIFIAHSLEPERSLPVYYLVMGLVTPFTLAAAQVQRVALSFPSRSKHDRATLKFSILVGLALGLFPWLSLIPSFAHWYYGHLQQLPPQDLPLVRSIALLAGLLPLLVALRAHGEGVVARERKTAIIVASMAVYIGTLTTAAGFALCIGSPGGVIGPVGLIAGNLGAAATSCIMLRRRPTSTATLDARSGCDRHIGG